MDNNRLNESSPQGVSSLEGMYTDFDEWVVNFTAYYKRSTYSSQEISSTKPQNPTLLKPDFFEKDSLFRDLLLTHWNERHTAKPPSLNIENDGFVFYDQLFYRFVNKNGDRQIVCQFVRSKL
ncbi:uncharacterized protein LOC110380813 [Helicoverpa armigera]|uniref:uncharacterized protein LOC110380813 n=1 Tax=Helicoverpa armigera TaxID=29058 RepID=UPI0030827D60